MRVVFHIFYANILKVDDFLVLVSRQLSRVCVSGVGSYSRLVRGLSGAILLS